MKIRKLDENIVRSKLILDESFEEATEDQLLEFKVDPKKAVERGVKRIEKADKSIKNVWGKFVKREVSPDTRDFKIYLAKPNGWESKPRLLKDVLSMYQKNVMDPRLMNAVVVTDVGDFIQRRGLEDFRNKGVKLTPDKMVLRTGYSVPFPASSKDVNSSDSTASATPTDTSTPQNANTEQIPSAQPQNETPVATPASAENTMKNTNAESQPLTNKPAEKTSNTSTSNVTRAKKEITPKILSNFKKIAYAAGIEIEDVFGRPVGMSNIKDFDNMTLDNLNQYEIDVKGQTLPLDKWLTKMVTMGILKEELNESLLTEAPKILFTDDELDNPDSIDFKKIIRNRKDKEEAEKAAEAKRVRKAELHNKYADIIDKIETSIGSGKDILETLEMLHDELVPPQGTAETVAGEIVRAMMRLVYRSYNDGDKFYSGYGIETCAGSAEYLYDMDSSFSEMLQHIVDEAYRIDSNDDLYDDMLKDLAKLVVEYIMENVELLEEENNEDSRNYRSSAWDVETEQPRYEFEIVGSADVEQLVEEGIIDAWELNSYVESELEYQSWYNSDAEIDTPWSHNSTTVTLSNLTKDAVDGLSDMFRDDEHIEGFWRDLVNEHESELRAHREEDENNEDDFDEE